MKIENNSIVAEDGKKVHRKGDNAYFSRATLLPGETLDSFEEVEEVPDIEAERRYEERVNELIRGKYTLSQELAILRQRYVKSDEFAAYNAYAEQCKAKAKEERDGD